MEQLHKYREIFEKSPTGIIFYDKEGIAVDANNSALKIMAISKLGAILGLSLFDNPNIKIREKELIDKGLIKFQAPLYFDNIKKLNLYTPTKSGTAFIDYTVSVSDSGYLVQIQDITEHKKAEEELMQERAIVESVLESSEGPVFSVDRNYRYTSFNLQHAKVMKNLFDADIEIGGNLLDYHTNPENRENAKLNIDKAFNGEVVNIESFAGDNPQNYRYFSIFHTHVRDSNENIIGVAVHAHDWTERKKSEEVLKESEEKFRSFFELPLIGIGITSPDKGWVEANDKICDILGYSFEELSKITWDKITYPDDLDKDVEQFNKLLNGYIDGYNLEKRFIRKDNSVVYANISVGCIRNEDNSVKYFVVMIEDITYRKKSEKALQKSEKLMNRSQKIAHLGSWELDLVNDRLYWSDEVYRIFGLQPQEFGASYEAFLEAVHPDVRKADDDAYSG
jgi:PAS domain S-box-containing protein